MRPSGVVIFYSLAMVAGLALAITGWRQPRPSVENAARRLHRPPDREARGARTTPLTGVSGIGSWILAGPAGPRMERFRTTSRLTGRSLESHVGLLAAAAIAGFVLPSLFVATARLAGVDTGSIVVPAIVSLGAAILLPVLVQSTAASTAEEVRLDLRHQLSAYFDMVTMLLAGNTGHEGALAQAAATGDGLLFEELRRRLREAGTTGQSHIRALEMVGDDFDLDELRQFAAAANLTAAEGAPVARTLAAKCGTLRSTMAAEQEARARVRNDKITPPLVGMALLFMILIIYPALQIN